MSPYPIPDPGFGPQEVPEFAWLSGQIRGYKFVFTKTNPPWSNETICCKSKLMAPTNICRDLQSIRYQ
jgi:hypothetical protein